MHIGSHLISETGAPPTEVEKTRQSAADNLEECFKQRTMETLSNELTT